MEFYAIVADWRGSSTVGPAQNLALHYKATSLTFIHSSIHSYNLQVSDIKTHYKQDNKAENCAGICPKHNTHKLYKTQLLGL